MEFKKLSDVEVVAEPAESANVLIEENGVIKKAPKTAVGGGDKWDMIINFQDGDLNNTNKFSIELGSYFDLYEKLMNNNKVNVLFKSDYEYGDLFHVRIPVSSFEVNETDSNIRFCLYVWSSHYERYLSSDGTFSTSA